MVFFALLKKSGNNNYTYKRDQHRVSLNNIKTQQHDTWMNVICSSYISETSKMTTDIRNTRICIKYFHPSILYLEVSFGLEKK